MARRRKDLGDWGEKQACCFLERHGFKIIERNYFTTFGEIDIVASHGGDYYFIEVKTRMDSAFANDDAVTPAKKNKLAKTVRAYCYKRKIGDVSLIMAGVIILADRLNQKANFRFCVFH
jgi:putative endonuclease